MAAAGRSAKPAGARPGGKRPWGLPAPWAGPHRTSHRMAEVHDSGSPARLAGLRRGTSPLTQARRHRPPSTGGPHGSCHRGDRLRVCCERPSSRATGFSRDRPPARPRSCPSHGSGGRVLMLPALAPIRRNRSGRSLTIRNLFQKKRRRPALLGEPPQDSIVGSGAGRKVMPCRIPCIRS